MDSTLPLVQVGDHIRIRREDGNDEGTRITAEVVSVKESKKGAGAGGYRYTLKLPGDEIVKTKLTDIDWKLKKKRKCVEEAAPAPADANDMVRKRFRADMYPGLPREISRKRRAFSDRFPVESLKYILAPMVGASELPFRLLCRKYGATLAYTPMINAEKFAVDEAYRNEEFQVTPADRPLVAHFGANNPQTLLAAARHVARRCDAIDLNLGCPQRVACAGHFGSFLLDEADRPLVLSIVRTLAEGLDIPMFVKIRLLDKLEDTLTLVNQLYDAGAALVAIHGRYRVNLTQRTGPGARDGAAHLDQIQYICSQCPHIPIIANGNVVTFEDVTSNLALTNAYGIMTAEGILDNPAIFHGKHVDKTKLASEYLAFVDQHPTKLKSVVFHVRRMCKDLLVKYQLLEDCVSADSIDIVKSIVKKLVTYEADHSRFRFDTEKAKKEKEQLAIRKAEEGKRKDFEARMVRKAKREGKDLNFYLQEGAEVPTEETIAKLKAMTKEAAFDHWKQHHKQHCWEFHFAPNGCARDRKCSFLHMDTKHNEAEIFG